jgi:DNA-binding SARP family transcriptional activator
VEARLLGPVELVQGGAPVPLRGPKERALVAVLAIHANEAVAEDTCIDAVWGDAPPPSASRTLQSYVSRLRRTLAGGDLAIEATPGGLVLRATPDAIDAVQAERLCGEAQRALDANDHDRAATLLRTAEGLWRGRSLGELADEPFAREEAARLDELRLTITEKRIDAELAIGGHRDLVPELEALTARHPLRERLWAARILALYRCGRQADALRAYQSLRELLAEELGIAPSPELRDLERAVLDQSPALEWRRTAQGTTAATLEPYAGRQAELARALAAWEEAASGASRVLLVGGEPGIGKTRFATEVAARTGAFVLHGRCDDVLSLPYGPFLDAVRAALPVLDDARLEAVPAVRRATLASVLPDLAQRLGTDVPPPDDPDTARSMVFDGVVDVLLATAAERPVLLVVDDMHWAPPATIQLFRYVVGRAVPGVLVLATYRDTELATAPGLADLLADLRRVHGVERIDLAGLGREEVGQLVQQAAGEDLGEGGRAFAETLGEAAAGNPFFLLEMLRDLVDRGVLHQEEGRWTSTLDLGELPLPSSVREVIQRRLTSLGEETAAALATAALVGPTFPVWLLEAIHGEDVLDALDAAVAARLLVDLPSGELGFAHALIRNAASGRLTPTRRRRLHNRLADALESAPSAVRHYAAISHHRSAGAEAGRTGEVVAAAIRAADEALGRLAAPEAVATLQRAVEALTPLDDPLARAEVLLSLSHAYVRDGDPHAAKHVALEVAAIARSAHAADHLARAAVAYLGMAWIGQPDPAGDGLLEEALELCGDDQPALRARVLSALAELRMTTQGRADEARVLSAEAEAIARSLDDPLVLAQTLLVRCITIFGLPDLDARLAVYDEMLCLAEEAGDRQLHALAVTTRAATRLEAADVDGFLADVAFLRRSVTSGRWGIAGRRASWLETCIHLLRGEWEDAEATMHAALAEAGDDINAINVYAGHSFVLHRETGRVADLLPTFANVVAANPGLALFAAALARSWAELGDHKSSTELYDELTAKDPGLLPGDQTWVATVSLVAETAALLGRSELAPRLYELLLPHRGHLVVVGATVSLATIDRHLGMLAHLLGRTDDAVAHLEDALALERRLDLRTFEPRTLVWLGRITGDPAPLREAAEKAAALGMAGVEAEATALLRG